MKKATKTTLVLIFMLLVLANYYAFIRMADESLSKIDSYLYLRGYYFGIVDIFNSVMKLVVPSFVLWGFIKVSGKHEFYTEINRLYSAMTIPLLLIYIALLPILLYLQNWFYGKWIKAQPPINN
ncbi:MAG: hypothetical protein A3I29_00630 [Candidatus Magasanikbacteria bacterium RIFCSPLOWO2_02_FULL_44_11]|uniref:Uncharacterized protein n=1 Tax=Candidatus Magasanikbacteria bacterium RIFCSPLOWO2_02_FULL_44_11 TaxID=1798689 RepID=A0A1F6NAF4_9BACT|nr:MAG: hypothetical protein A3I29_00630 [Candidatus Magasanikbacteria bacterium RIFCSPLOWO2_02_FULL_44_11]